MFYKIPGCPTFNNQCDTVSRLTKHESILVISFLTLFIFPLLYLSRSLDNNTLTSWQWIFRGVHLHSIYLMLIASLAASFLLSHTAVEKHPLVFLPVVAMLAIVPLWREPELLLDSSRYFLQAKHLSQYGILSFWQEWGHSINAWTDLPLSSFLYGLLFELFGEERIVIQIFNTLLFILTLLLTTLCGEILINKQSGFFAGLLLIGLPYLMTQTPLMLVDTHTMFFMSLSFYTFLKAQEREKRWVILSSMTIAMAMLVKFSTWPMLMILPLIAIAGNRKRPAEVLGRMIIIFALAAVLISPFLIVKHHLIAKQFGLLMRIQKPLMTVWMEHPASRFFFQTHPFITLLAGWGVYLSARRKNYPLLVMGIFLLFFFVQVGRIRYILPLMPFFTITAATGLSAFKEIKVQRFIALTIVLTAVIITQTAYLPFLRRTSMANITDAATYINALPNDSLEIYFFNQQRSGGNTASVIPLLDLSVDKIIIARQEWAPTETSALPPITPLIFTWLQKNPPTYRANQPTTDTPLVVISGAPVDEHIYTDLRGTQPARIKHFTSRTDIFRFKTFVSVFH